MSDVHFTLDVEPVRVAVREGESLLETLRGRLGLISFKDGCHP